ncbi:MAG TPA: SRPBCC family protein [Acidobacteriaceae bacterium]|nr:SRPBCC family protein [Acidobacteriaceae bacterium]
MPFPVARVFAFFADPGNLPRLMPEWQKVRIDALHSVPPLDEAGMEARTANARPGKAAGAGSSIVLSFRPIPLLPLRLSWVARITEFTANEGFCDEQERGPFAYWRHCHATRVEVRGGVAGTAVRDDLEYEIPLGRAGDMAHALVRRQIEGLFAYRQRRLPELLWDNDSRS